MSGTNDMSNKVLVVDDEPDFCEALRDFLGSKGYEVAIALSGEEALLAYMQEKPDVVLLDMMMPGMSGLVTLRELKGLDQGANVIMVTAVHEEDIAKQAMAEGAFDYITKPVNRDYLELVILTKIILLEGDE
ncbi:MAG: response regulator [bacterium]|nr:response regulator [bacterium]